MGKSARSVSIIGGADGPTSIFIAGKSGKINILECLKRYCYRKRKVKLKKRLLPMHIHWINHKQANMAVIITFIIGNIVKPVII